MPKHNYEKYISDDSIVYVFFENDKRKVVRFTVKLLSKFGNQWYEVVRYDSGHGIPHKDILTPDGKVSRKIWYKYMNNNQALDFALDEMNEQMEFYKWRFEQWLKQKHQA
ncbi:MAG: hypothetical protein HY960_00045 [Ignavibacteriae bacterium]|nr:hypothetical protein [Ignavibacteriota bacterium]